MNDFLTPKTMDQESHCAFIWSVADLLRGDCQASDYGKVALPVCGIAPAGLGANCPSLWQTLPGVPGRR